MKIWAVLAIVAGSLVTGLSGLCTLTFGLGMANNASFLPTALMFGGPFIVGGLVVVWLGVDSIRKGRKKR